MFSLNDCLGQMTRIKGGGSRLGDPKGRDERCFLLSLLVGSPACLWDDFFKSINAEDFKSLDKIQSNRFELEKLRRG